MGRLPSFCSRMKQEHPTGQVTYEQCLIIICHFLTLVVTFSKDFNCRPYPLLLSPLSLDRCSPLQSLFPSALVCTAVLRSTLATIATDCPFSGGFCCLPLPPDLVPAFSRAEVRYQLQTGKCFLQLIPLACCHVPSKCILQRAGMTVDARGYRGEKD